MKADKDAYLRLASKLDDAGFDALSMEDKHRRNDPELFLCFKKLKVSSVFLFHLFRVLLSPLFHERVLASAQPQQSSFAE